MKSAIFAAVAAAVLAAAAPAAAQDYPSKPIRMIIPYNTGGGGDYVGRAFSEELGKVLGQPIVVENHGGGSTVIGTNMVATAAPDGYTIGLINNIMVSNPFLLPSLPYETPGSFETVARLVTYPMVLAGRVDLPANSVKELVELSKQSGAGLTNATSGAGSGADLSSELLSLMAGLKVRDIPFNGTGPVMNALAGGHVDIGFAGMTQVRPMLEAGKVKVFGSTGLSTMNTTPPVPAIADEVPGYSYILWWGIVVPKGTPQPVVDKLNAALKEVFADQAVVARMDNLNGEFGVTSPAEFREFFDAELEKWGGVIKEAGIKAE